MQNKKDLAKIALTALILASTTPVNGQASIHADGIVLAASCAAHGCPGVKSSSGDSGSTANMSYYNPNASATLTEAQLLDMLNPQGKSIYLSLDPEGKALAIQLASQDSYRDKNLAIKEAQRRMNERRSQTNR